MDKKIIEKLRAQNKKHGEICDNLINNNLATDKYKDVWVDDYKDQLCASRAKINVLIEIPGDIA